MCLRRDIKDEKSGDFIPVASTKVIAARTLDVKIFVFTQGFALRVKLDVCC